MLRNQIHRHTTKTNYYRIWKKFNSFFLKLDSKPKNWEDRLTLYIAHMIQNNLKSTTIKCYISAIKAILSYGHIQLNEDRCLLNSLTRACQLKNDRVRTKFPVTKNVLKVMLSTMDHMAFFSTQPYLQFLYKALFVTAYFGLFRICELTLTPSHHMVHAANVHIGKNKNKLMFVLHTSKMHNKGKKPQIIKIAAESFTRESSRLEICPF